MADQQYNVFWRVLNRSLAFSILTLTENTPKQPYNYFTLIIFLLLSMRIGLFKD
ncbi:hypothetical protein [Aphanothece hegewaldii]|uniref:hypothetical protein n=1 Tax=Aphanothece hegewaldii TaxID=1521625 RepID=UPI0015E64E7E|nr:hypothetical protein [Aphanothece hegewaldii]